MPPSRSSFPWAAGAAVLLAAMGLGCSATAPDVEAHPVVEGDACHLLLLDQCDCCGERAEECRNRVQWMVQQGTARVLETTGQCAGQAGDDLCERLASDLEGACQGYVPTDEPDAE